MQAQRQREQPAPHNRLLGPQEALAWLTASSLFTLHVVCRIVDRILRHKFVPPSQFILPVLFFIALLAWQRVRRGEAVTDPLTALEKIPNRATKLAYSFFVVFLFMLSIAMMITAMQSTKFSLWMQFSTLCLFGANVILGTLLARHRLGKKKSG